VLLLLLLGPTTTGNKKPELLYVSRYVIRTYCQICDSQDHPCVTIDRVTLQTAPPPFRDFLRFFQMMRQKVVKVVSKRSVRAGLSHYATYAAKFLTVIFFWLQ